MERREMGEARMSGGPYSYDRIRAGQEGALQERAEWRGDCPYLTQTGDKSCRSGCWQEPICQTDVPYYIDGEYTWGPEPTGYQWEPIR
jgi:hypothetical protein